MRCYDVLPAATAAFIAEMGAALPGAALRGVCRRAAAAVREADVAVTAIPIVTEPGARAGRRRRSGRARLAVSLDYDSAWTSAAMRDCDKFCADDVPQLLATREHGVYFGGIPEAIHADLGELAAGLKPGRERRRRAHLLHEHGHRRGRHGHGEAAVRAREASADAGTRLPL